MLGETQQQKLLCDLYGQLSEPERLTRFLSTVAAATGSHLGLLIRQNLRHCSGSMLTAFGLSASEMARYESEFSKENLWFERAGAETRAGFVFVSDDWLQLEELRETRWYNDYLRTIDVAHGVGICGQFDAGQGVFLSLCRAQRTGAYDEDAKRLLQWLTPHFVNVCQLRSQLEGVLFQPSGVAHQRALFLFDRSFRWINDNPAAAAMVVAGWWRGNPGASIEPVHAASRAAWQLAQRAVAASVQPRVIPVYDRNQTLTAFARLYPYSNPAYADGPAYALFVRPLRRFESPGMAGQLRHLFDLTPGETQLALALRKHSDLERAAASMGIAISGARTRLQSVLSKTGTHRQSELVRLLDALTDTLSAA